MAVNKCSSLTVLNIPDMLSKPLKPWHAADAILDTIKQWKGTYEIIPHIRTRDYTLEELNDIIAPLAAKGLQSVLLITGDPPKEGQERHPSLTPVTVLEAVPYVKKNFPSLKVYCGMDQYRRGIRDELAYCKQKKDVGCDGFFSQAFFSPYRLEEWAAQLSSPAFEGTEFWAGLSPVTTHSFKGYWERVNKAVFPPSFSTTLEHNVASQKAMIEVCVKYGCNTYLMPITVGSEPYINALLAQEEEPASK
jgi:methylenetetrahydrofolate reductase (NADPH)